MLFLCENFVSFSRLFIPNSIIIKYILFMLIYAFFSLIHNIVTHVMKLAQAKTTLCLAPALVETYSRLLVYNEIESLGIKGFISESSLN